MISINFKKMAAVAALGIFALLGSSNLANAQGNSKHKQMKNEQKAAKNPPGDKRR